ncbi:MSHA biogenesis protein MshP [Vibrio crassostreae]|uniref:MSHA biogenesis protein MshP n=1 Tax=Vibrio crassostreae TaxID=246167 RepID=UPI00104945D0|nr:MSHA biogenesis protein MshP [Vibrio crassostreae]TCN90807.1 MSHA biogenesis protein MshP [Vibrio crassostreae]CAK2430344.1 MSHA biogenesis protein MshP [Vibrio crassostreae]CAK2487733.1 MSHA biogenesis protein MshP [Vibrio crassostreae]CAK2656309.1 MSHA biogenesis protein MshP [Vibrio crassostreae]CAK3116401.1 MSHA biogenesis protein MshP [Vibrio crassostreae]
MSRSQRYQRYQSGNVLIVVVFVIVVMGFLAHSLTRVGWSNSDSLTREQLGTQAWLLSHSANEWALTQLYPIPLLSTSAAFDSMCTNTISGARPNLVTAEPCQAPRMSCMRVGDLNNQRFYKVEAKVICGSGRLQVERVQEVWVKE